MKVVCPICPHHCGLEEGQVGLCRARGNRGGEIRCLNYGRITSMALDPIEKKPLRGFYPGNAILSVGSYGCNLRCPFCQNSDISMANGENAGWSRVSPEALAQQAEKLIPMGNLGVAYTYNEPLVGYEYVRDCAQLIHEADLKNVIVTNGMICEEPLKALLPLLDAANIDLKAFSEGFYQNIGGDLEAVKRTISLAAQRIHVEVTTLVIPDVNDSDEEMQALSRWLSSVSPDLTLHISRFFPRYQMQNKPPTPVGTIRRLAGIANKHLRHVYTGNC